MLFDLDVDGGNIDIESKMFEAVDLTAKDEKVAT